MKAVPILFKHEDLIEVFPKAESFYVFICREIKKGHIKQIKNGLYALVDPSTRHIFANKFQIACQLFDDSYFSYHEALEYYGLANQSFVSRFTYVRAVTSRNVSFEDVIFSSKVNKCELQIINRMKEEDIRVVSLERALVDSMESPSLAGGLEEIEYALSSYRFLKIENVIQMLEYYDKAYLYQKAGYLFEKYYGDIFPESFFNYCLSKIGKKVHYFESKVGSAVLISKWRLMVPKERELPDELL